MTISDFRKISRRIIQSEIERNFSYYDAVCFSRKLYYDLLNQVSLYFTPPSETGEERLFGLTIFVDDEMPDDYYQLGYASEFLERFKEREKLASDRE